PLLSREQWYKLIPTYAYADDADPKKWKQTLIKEYNLNTVKDTAFKFSELKKLNSGKYLIYFQTTDSFGNSIEHAHFFDLIDSKEKKSSLPDEFTFELEKSVLNPGEKASIWIGSSRNASGWMYVECNQKPIHFQRIYTNGILNELEIPVFEDYRGGFTIHLMLTSSNRTITKKFYINVPYRNELQIQPEKIAEFYKPGDKGQWRLAVTDQDGKPVNSEVTAVLYDASLDQFATNEWSFNPEIYNASGTGILYDVNPVENSEDWTDYPQEIDVNSIDFPSLNWFDDGSALGRGYKGELRIRGVSSLSRSKGVEVSDLEEFMTVEASNKMKFVPPVLKADEQVKEESTGNKEKQEKLIQNVQTRKNFSETAFFYPHLLTDAQGKVTIDYTLPESLTRWKLMILAHTQDMKHGFLTQQIVTRKNLMLQAFFPRIVREGDELEFSSR
ncbi:MAG: alpha-2-macroglobulin family protein, partial [Bacteroidota bacterium]|nr:alpha-2-macroglobulin family protein [Bacteroidota bacterium]